MNVDKIVVLNIPSGALERFSKSEIPAPEGWQALVGDDGASFFIRPFANVLLLSLSATADVSEQLAQRLQRLLGPTLENHVDLRGIFVVTSNPADGQSYEEITAAGNGEWIARAAPPEQAESPGWSFADAARTFATPGTRPRADAVVANATKVDDPLEAADGKFGAIFASQNDRGALRRTLSAALDHSLDASLLASVVDNGEDSKNTEENSPVAGIIRRSVSSDPKTMNALEASLRAAVDGGLKSDSETDASSEKPAEDS